ncbi:MAG: hypothetical protein HY821_01280 [Acidobacteria bacterium]|nr:hypothetical protein [Acidobacteriota bacterium]
MSSSTVKRVVIERFDRELLRGFVKPQHYLLAEGLELMSPDGSVAIVPLDQIKAVSFVRDPDGDGVLSERRSFLARPKVAGLWVEARFRDGDAMEGVMPNNLLQVEHSGYSLSPPETGGNAQRVFVPRKALADLQVLGVVGTRKKRPAAAVAEQQIRLFAED